MLQIKHRGVCITPILLYIKKQALFIRTVKKKMARQQKVEPNNHYFLFLAHRLPS